MANFVQTPLTILEAEMPDSHKIGIQWLMYQCWQSHCDTVRGTYRGLARLLHLAKTSFISKILPAWIKAGWVAVEQQGKELVLTLQRDRLICPKMGQNDRMEDRESVPPPTTSVPSGDTFVPPSDTDVLPRDKSVPLVSSKEDTVRESTESLLEESREEENVTCLLKQKWDTIPELTPELGLELVRAVLDVPPRPKAGRALELWMQRWYEPMSTLIEDLRPMMGPLAWVEIDEIIRFMASTDSGWMRKMGRLPTLENVVKTRHIQHEQMAKLGWQPDARTPYPGLAEEQEWETQTETTAPVGIRSAYPFASREALEDFAWDLIQAHPTLQLSVDDGPDGPGPLVLLLQHAPDEYLCIDPGIWNTPSQAELDYIYAAIDYGQQACLVQEAVAI